MYSCSASAFKKYRKDKGVIQPFAYCVLRDSAWVKYTVVKVSVACHHFCPNNLWFSVAVANCNLLSKACKGVLFISENHRTQSLYDDALIIKLFAFQFANSYSSLYYIAFFRRVSEPLYLFINLETCFNTTLMKFSFFQYLNIEHRAISYHCKTGQFQLDDFTIFHWL